MNWQAFHKFKNNNACIKQYEGILLSVGERGHTYLYLMAQFQNRLRKS